MKSISQVARLTGISIRTLQYYDEIGLLKPSELTASGYRLYNDEALQTLQQILFFKELGFSLKEIKEILENPDFDRIAAFKKQKELFLLKRNRINRLIELLERLEQGEACIWRGIEMNFFFQLLVFKLIRQILLLHFGRYDTMQEMEYLFSQERFMEYTIRQMVPEEYPLLNDFLYEAIFIPDGTAPPPKNIIASPGLQIYVDRFGSSKADFALVAEVEQKIVGAVWVRIINDYGHIDDETPSLAISLYKEYRGHGIGTDMMKEMLSLLKAHGYKRVSLSVQKANYAAEMYRKIGFDMIRENKEDWIMLWQEGRH